MSRTFIACLLLCLLDIPVVAYGEGGGAGPSMQIISSQIPEIRLFNATLEAVNQSTVSAQTSGRVIEINFDVDDYVKKDSILLRIGDKEQRSRLSSAESSMKEAQANAEQAEKEYLRVKNIYEKKLVAKSELDKALSANKSAAARLKASRAKVDEAREQWEHTIVRAPYSGIVVKRFVQMGESANVGQELMTGISLDHLRAIVDLPQGVAAKVRNKAVMFVLIPGRGRVDIDSKGITVFPFAEELTHSFRTRLELPAGLPDLYPGMMIKVGVEVEKSEAILVPVSAVVLRSEVVAVYIEDTSGQVLFRQVRIGGRVGDQIKILAGLQPGEKLLLDPSKAVIALKSQRAR